MRRKLFDQQFSGCMSDIPETGLEGAQKRSNLQFGIFSKGHEDCVLCNRGVKKSINTFLHLRCIRHMV